MVVQLPRGTHLTVILYLYAHQVSQTLTSQAVSLLGWSNHEATAALIRLISQQQVLELTIQLAKMQGKRLEALISRDTLKAYRRTALKILHQYEEEAERYEEDSPREYAGEIVEDIMRKGPFQDGQAQAAPLSKWRGEGGGGRRRRQPRRRGRILHREPEEPEPVLQSPVSRQISTVSI